MIRFPDGVATQPVAALLPYARNARTHSESQIVAIAASMVEFGFTNPVLIDGAGGIIAGHGRVLAARRLGLEAVPVVVLDHLTETQKRAYILADNKLALNAGWDEALLALELADLKDQDFNLDLTGFGLEEVEALLAGVDATPAGETDADAVPDVPAEAITQLGEVWLLGRHRLGCGDCTEARVVEQVLDGVVPHLMVTDPPYGVTYQADWRSSLDQWNRATGRVQNDDRADWRAAYVLFPGDVAYVWHADKMASEVQNGLESCGFELRNQIIWVKPHYALSRGDYHVQHEPCFYAVRKTRSGHWAGDRKQSTVWQIANGTFQGGKPKAEDAKTGHGTQKPVECMRRPIENNSRPGEAVYDPFVGSGTTLIAAEQTGRRCYAIELNPAYVDVCCQRWQTFTGKQAILAGDGRTFAEIAAERADAPASTGEVA